MAEFFLTAMGRRFYEVTMPELVKQLARLNENMEKRMAWEDARSAAAKGVLDAQLAEAERFLAAMKKEQEEKPANGSTKLCSECGEPAHIHYCPKPPDIPKETWQTMTDDERLSAEEGAGHDMDRCAKHHAHNCPDCHPMPEDAEER